MFRSTLHGCPAALQPQQAPWYPKSKLKDAYGASGRLTHRLPVVRSTNKWFEQSHRPRGSFPSVVKQSSKPSSVGPETVSKFRRADQNAAQYSDLDAAKSSLSASSSSALKVDSPSVRVSRQPAETAGEQPAPSNIRNPSSGGKQRYVGSVMWSQRHVQQEYDTYGSAWKTAVRLAAETRARREGMPAEVTGGRRDENPLELQGVRIDTKVAQQDASHVQVDAEAAARAAPWYEAARKLSQNRKPRNPGAVLATGSPTVDDVNTDPGSRDGFENGCRGPQASQMSQTLVPEFLSARDAGQLLDSETGGLEAAVGPKFASAECNQLEIADPIPDTAEVPAPTGERRQRMNAEVLVVNDVSTAQAVVETLTGQCKDLIHACDTEVAEIDVKKESPVGHGRMICFSIYCGPDADFGDGKCRLWVDVLDNSAVLDVFRKYFEDPNIKKVWHNYSFDKHILGNYGIDVQGFYADTMHLARLHDSARTVTQGGYSLEGLTADKRVMGGHWGDLGLEEEYAGKRSMKHLFGKANIKKNGEEGKLRVVPPVEDLQTQPEWRDKWIHYSSFDTVCTWCLWKSLREKLIVMEWKLEGRVRQEGKFMYDFYMEYLQPFGALLVQMEAEGMMLDCEHLAQIEEIATKQQELSANQFKIWAAKRCPDAVHMNVGSDAQIRQLLFGGKENKSDPERKLEMERVFSTPNSDDYVEEGRKTPKKTRPFTLRGLGVDIPVDSYTSSGWPAVGGRSLKSLAGKVSVDYTMLDNIEPARDPSVGEDSAILTSTGVKGGSEEDLSVYGKAYDAFGGGRDGKEACMAFAALCEVASINTLISNFIQPLQGSYIKGPAGRIHCSLNINTETGRLSARRPSLQNQPAMEKDRYKIRQAFIAAPGNSLIVADYGQLELRILAHLTNCKSMLKAFKDGGDFHSRTALNMYPHVRKAVEKGDVILEWEPNPGESKPPVPLLKDVFGSERRKAKMLNFSIAYGKTPMGLSKDWKVSLDEAKSTVELWYSDRREVQFWQKQRIKEATETHYVHTLLGRTRHFPDVQSCSKLVRGHIERAAINTPVQGSAADVAMCAMLEISRNEQLQELGWKLVLQVHDEVILEGPSDSAPLAKDIVVKCMRFPFRGKNNLRVELSVDAKHAQSWYAAK